MDALRKLARDLIAQGVIGSGVQPKPEPARKRKLLGIREAVSYLAYNDEGELGDEDTGGYTVCVMMVAHLFGYEGREVAEMVMRKRERDGI